MKKAILKFTDKLSPTEFDTLCGFVGMIIVLLVLSLAVSIYLAVVK
jgi:hypothetical protein